VGPVVACRIFRILTPVKRGLDKHSVIVVEHFDVGAVNDARLNMPILTRAKRTLILSPKVRVYAISFFEWRQADFFHTVQSILFSFNAQHDCITANCQFESVPVLQERQTTERTQMIVKHTDDARFILNMHALHNSHLIRKALPHQLTKPVLRFPDRAAIHNQLAAKLRETGPAKRAESKAKSQATRALNKAAKQKATGRRTTTGPADSIQNAGQPDTV